MSDNQVHALFYALVDSPVAPLRGLFESRELAEKRLLEQVLRGGNISGARIDVLTVETAEPQYDEKDPLRYPDVIASLIEQKKIQAIKSLREKCVGLGLKEAKDAVERVNLLELPEALRVEAQKLVEAREAEERARQTRYQHKHEFWAYDVIEDNDGDRWVRIGGGEYVNELRAGLLPLVGDGVVRSRDDIDDAYGIASEYDF